MYVHINNVEQENVQYATTARTNIGNGNDIKKNAAKKHVLNGKKYTYLSSVTLL